MAELSRVGTELRRCRGHLREDSCRLHGCDPSWGRRKVIGNFDVSPISALSEGFRPRAARSGLPPSCRVWSVQIHDKARTGTQPGNVRRSGKPRHGVPESAERPSSTIQKVLERLVEKGKLIVKKAYADWNRYQNYTAPFHEAANRADRGFPSGARPARNSADIRLVVDAMDLAWSKPHVDTFVIVSGGFRLLAPGPRS